MAKLLYHRGTGTYFDLHDDVFLIDTSKVAEPVTDELMDEEGDEIAVYYGKPVLDVIVDLDY